LDFPVQIKVVPTVRDTDALALSSRNAYLNAADRDNARVIPYSLDVAKRMILQNRHVRPARVIAAMKKLIQARKGSRIDYISICDADTLGPLERSSVKILVALAVFAGKTRLIDNVVVGRG
jgi:pantoate--beta-alanine ligase